MVTHFLAVLSGLVIGYLLIYEFNPEEESICSKQMIEKMVRMEVKMEQLDKEWNAFEKNVLSILEHRKEEMNKVFQTQSGTLEKDRKLFENNVSSVLEHRREEMNEGFRTQNDKFEKERKLFEDNVSSVLEHRREEMNVAVRTQNGKLEKLIADLNNVRDDVRNVTANIENVAESIKDTPKVAFNAYTLVSGSYPENNIVIFPNVLLNEGGGYNKYTGTFTAPVSGLYQFHAHVCHQSESYMVVSIVLGSKTLALTSAYGNVGLSCSSVSAPAQVIEGESVFIKSSYSGSKLYGNVHRWPSFSGFLVNE